MSSAESVGRDSLPWVTTQRIPSTKPTMITPQKTSIINIIPIPHTPHIPHIGCMPGPHPYGRSCAAARVGQSHGMIPTNARCACLMSLSSFSYRYGSINLPHHGAGPGPPRRHRGLLYEHGHEGPGPHRQGPRLAVDGVEVPADAHTPEPDGGQAVTGHLATHRMHRHEGDAEAGHHRLLDGLGVVELHADPPAHPRLLECALGDLPGGRALLAHQQRLLGETRRGHLPGPRPGMAPAH